MAESSGRSTTNTRQSSGIIRRVQRRITEAVTRRRNARRG